MTYERALAYLKDKEKIGWKLELNRMRQLLSELDNPHLKGSYIHIAGTNGKGSVAALLESILRRAGYSTGLYTSPHLIDVRERIRVNGEMIDKNHFADLLTFLQPWLDRYKTTFFETLTLLAFVYFSRCKVDIVCLEVGLGGRLDATNVVSPELSIITPVSFDHTEHLGSTLAAIAKEKAGIVKKNIPCLAGKMAGPAGKIIDQKCRSVGAPFFRSNDKVSILKEAEIVGMSKIVVTGETQFTGKYDLALNGDHQVENCEIVIVACDLLVGRGWTINSQDVRNGLAGVKWQGRFQVIDYKPLLVLDVAHNSASIKSLIKTLRSLFQAKRILFVIGILNDKNGDHITELVSKIAYAVQPVEAESFRSLSAQKLHNYFASRELKLFPARSVRDGLFAALNHSDDFSVVCITGSHYVVGEALYWIKGLTK